MYFLICATLNELKTNMTRRTHVYWLAKLTIHFGVGLPLVVPASEGLAVVLGTLLGPEVHSVNGARPSVTQLVETAGAGAKFTVVLRSTCTTWREKHRWRENFIKLVISLPGLSFFVQDLEPPTVISDPVGGCTLCYFDNSVEFIEAERLFLASCLSVEQLLNICWTKPEYLEVSIVRPKKYTDVTHIHNIYAHD